MISFLKGALDSVYETCVVVDVGGVGYRVHVSTATGSKLPGIGEEVKLFTTMHVKEDGITLYGFISMDELDMFNMLISVSGVGPKAAVAMLGAMKPSDIILAIVSDDAAALLKAPGIGKKTAQRLVLELKDRFKTGDAVAAALDPQQAISYASSEKQDAIDALTALGYSRGEAVRAVLEAAIEGMTAEQIIKQALRKLAGN